MSKKVSDMTLLFKSGDDWNEDILKRCWEQCEIYARERLKQTYYPPQIEIVSAAQMLDAYTSSGLPIYYPHWSFGKELIRSERQYLSGKMNLSYEIVINSNPCIAYLMEENAALTQLLVIAHASIGHSAVFKNNYLFKSQTDAAGIIGYLSFAKRYVLMCEERYGQAEVESVLDACHALSLYGTDNAKRHRKLNSEQEEQKAIERFAQQLYDYDMVWEKVGKGLVTKNKGEPEADPEGTLAEPVENILYYIEKHANIPNWQKELIRITRMIAQYFEPQRKCLTGNHLVAVAGKGLIKLRDLVKAEGLSQVENVSLLSTDGKYQQISHTYKESQATVLKLETVSGRSFCGTPEHPLQVFRDGKFQLIPIESIKPGDYLALNKRHDQPIFALEEVNLPDIFNVQKLACKFCNVFESHYLPTHISQAHDVSIEQYRLEHGEIFTLAHRIGKSANKIQAPKTLDSNLAELLGYIISTQIRVNDVDVPNSGFAFYSLQPNVSTKICELLLKVFDINVEATPNEFIDNTFDICFNSFSLKYFLQAHFNIDNKAVPTLILQSPKTVIGSFIKALIDVMAIRRSSVAKFELSGYLAHEELFEDLAAMLLGFGIVSRVYKSKLGADVETLHFSILPDYYSAFNEQIGSIHDLPKDVNLINSNLAAVLPGGEALCSQLKFEIEDWWEEHSYKHEEGSTADAMQLHQLIELGKSFHFDKVISVKELYEKHDVYDVTVPANHLFYVNGVISHNTKVLNEGYATFTHYDFMHWAYDKGLIDEGSMIEFYAMHSGVTYQRPRAAFNPYKLGFEIFMSLKAACEHGCEDPDDEPYHGHLKGKSWQEVTNDAMVNYNDETFILQFLAPSVAKKMEMFAYRDNGIYDEEYIVTEVARPESFRELRAKLSAQYHLSRYKPDIQVVSHSKNGQLTLKHFVVNNRPLNEEQATDVVVHASYLWGGSVELVMYLDDGDGETSLPHVISAMAGQLDDAEDYIVVDTSYGGFFSSGGP
jgi:spore cortex formation protein SpoVR/YcgB (stage V sporulation)